MKKSLLFKDDKIGYVPFIGLQSLIYNFGLRGVHFQSSLSRRVHDFVIVNKINKHKITLNAI